MRLLDTYGLELVDVAGDNMPEYAILSHTWGQEEVTFQDLQYISHKWSRAVSQTVSAIKAKSGYTKIKRSASLAAEHGYGFIWIDTCCIDKTSSAELSEAINSMYTWYKKAAKCYAYLEDVRLAHHQITGSIFRSICQHSRWFTRGWTLQELIAPDDVMFYSTDWQFLGSKADDENVRASLAGITGIDVRVLEGIMSPTDISVATRMKWASKRQTTREEDIAYSLMGLFDVNMPLLYGEGAKAFVRLQEEILKGSDDHTIFVWKTSTPKEPSEQLCGLLAESPAAFANVNNFHRLPPAVSRESSAWAITNHGLRISLYLQPFKQWGVQVFKDEYDAVLECATRRGDGWSVSPAIRLRRLYGDQFARVDPQTVRVVTTPSYDQGFQSGSYEVIYVKQKPVYAVPEFVVSFDNVLQSGVRQLPIHLTEVWPPRYWDSETATLRATPSDANRIVGLFRFTHLVFGVSIDCAVGLKRSPGGTWDCWRLLRRVGYESPSVAAASANTFLERDDALYPESQGLLRWVKNVEGLDSIVVNIRHIHMHGRAYLSVQASPAMEVPGSHFNAKDPVELFSPGLALPVDDTRVPLKARLQSLLADLTVPTTLENSFLVSEAPTLPRIRTVPLVSLAEEFKRFVSDRVIEGPTPEATKILQACIEGDIDDLRGLAAADPLLESVTIDLFDLKPLHWAIIEGHLLIVELLVELGADITSRTTQGWLPFHLAAIFGRFTVLNWLLYGTFVEVRSGLTPWTEGQLLRDQNNTLKENLIHMAVVNTSMVYGEDYDALYKLLRRALTKEAWLSTNCYGETPFHRLAAVGEIHIQSDHGMMEFFADAFLGELGFDTRQSNLSDNKGRTILWHAVCAGSAEIIQLLVNLNLSSVRRADKYGITPLHLACRKGNTKVIKLLLLAGADPNARTKAPGLTPSHYAVIFNQPAALRLLLDHGADVTLPTKVHGESFRPIHLALAGKYRECTIILKLTKIDRNWLCTHYIRRVQSENDLCPFELVQGYQTVIGLLKDPEVPARDQKKTPLSIGVDPAEDEDGNIIQKDELDQSRPDETDVEYRHSATLNPTEYGKMVDGLLRGDNGQESGLFPEREAELLLQGLEDDSEGIVSSDGEETGTKLLETLFDTEADLE